MDCGAAVAQIGLNPLNVGRRNDFFYSLPGLGWHAFVLLVSRCHLNAESHAYMLSAKLVWSVPVARTSFSTPLIAVAIKQSLLKFADARRITE